MGETLYFQQLCLSKVVAVAKTTCWVHLEDLAAAVEVHLRLQEQQIRAMPVALAIILLRTFQLAVGAAHLL